MIKFKVGDKVRLANGVDRDGWLYGGLPDDTVLTVVNKYVDYSNEIHISTLSLYPDDFVKVEPPIEFTSHSVHDGNGTCRMRFDVKDGNINILAEEVNKTLEDRLDKELGVYRPDLKDRKVAKVPMHMVVDGFPRALREVAKVMGWAADAKGYKLHDWVNLPNADTDFPSAGYRHMIDNSIMKSEGTNAIDRVDHESNLVHLAHEVFNKLAELELVLTGKIK